MSQEIDYKCGKNEFGIKYLVTKHWFLHLNESQDFADISLMKEGWCIFQVYVLVLEKDLYVAYIPHLNRALLYEDIGEHYPKTRRLIKEFPLYQVLDYEILKKKKDELAYYEEDDNKVVFSLEIKLFDDFGDVFYHYLSFYGFKYKKYVFITRISYNLKYLSPKYRDYVRDIPYTEELMAILGEEAIVW